MPIQFHANEAGTTLDINVTGKLSKEDYEKFVPEFDEQVRLHGRMRILFDMTGFEGWESGAVWSEVKFGLHHFSDIEMLAMVGDNKWEHAMASFCKPFTKAAVKYFDHTDVEAARTWLSGS
jgi:hypothetical protein